MTNCGRLRAIHRLIIGDPTCGALAPSATSNSATWTSAVMATAGGNTVVGNRVVWGSAPVLARGTHPGADKGITDGIAYAAALAPTTGHATGVYLDASCDAQEVGPNPALVNTLNMLSVGTARPWTENAHPTCGTSVSFIGTAPEFSDVTTSDFTGWPCAVHESFPTFETDSVPLAISTDSPDASTCGTDTTTQATHCGEAFFLAAGPETAAMDSEIAVTPLTATNPVGTTHTITATVNSVAAGTPLVGQLVSFSVSGANAGATGTCVPADCKTNSAGQVTFTYVGTNAGNDTITASFMCNPAIHTATADKTWVAPPADDHDHDNSAADHDDRPARRVPSRAAEMHPPTRRVRPVPRRYRDQLASDPARQPCVKRTVHHERRRKETPLRHTGARHDTQPQPQGNRASQPQSTDLVAGSRVWGRDGG